MSLGGSGQNGYGESVDQYTLEGKFVRTFHSIAEAENVVGEGSGNVSPCCVGTRKTSLGYLWCYHGEPQSHIKTLEKLE